MRPYCLPAAAILTALFTGSAVFAGFDATAPSLRKLGIPFVENRGQTDAKVGYYTITPAGTLFVTNSGELVLVPATADTEAGRAVAVTERLVGAQALQPQGLETSPTRIHSFLGSDPRRWRTNIPTFGSLSLGEVYPGIELRLHAHSNTVEKVFQVDPKGDPGRIRIQVSGYRGLSVGAAGQLTAETIAGPLTYSAPVAYQEVDGERRSVEVAYLVERDCYGFRLGEYDRTRTLTIDPILSTYLGGADLDAGVALATSGGVNIYIAGYTTGIGTFPNIGEPGGIAFGGGGGNRDAFVARLDSDFRVADVVYLGGALADEATDIAVHPGTGKVFVVGHTEGGFPSPATGMPGRSDLTDAFVVRLSEDLATLEDCRYIGGSDNDRAFALAIEPRPDGAIDLVYVVGETRSRDLELALDGDETVPQAGFGGGSYDAFIAVLGTGALNLLRSSYLGGSSTDRGFAVAVNAVTHDVYVAGQTSYNPGLGVYTGAFPWIADQDSFGGETDVFLVRLQELLHTSQTPVATYLGGERIEFGQAVSVHPSSGDVYVAGGTICADTPTTNDANFPATGGYTLCAGDQDAFVASFSPGLETLNAATMYGGRFLERAHDLLAAPAPLGGDLYVLGRTRSTDLPGTTGAADPVGGADLFIARFNPALTEVEQATYLGGSGYDEALGHGLSLAADLSYIFAAGTTSSDDLPGVPDVPGTVVQQTRGGSTDAFVARLEPHLGAVTTIPDIDVEPEVLEFGNVLLGTTPKLLATLNNTGGAPLAMTTPIQLIGDAEFTLTTGTGFGVCDSLTPTIPAGESCDLVLTFVPLADGYYEAELRINSNDPDESAVAVAMKGHSKPDITVLPGQPGEDPFVQFGDTVAGSEVTASFNISNDGGADLTVTAIDLTLLPDAYALLFAGGSGGCPAPSGADPIVLAVGDSCRVDVVFSPPELGLLEGEARITSDDPDEGTVTVHLLGTGVSTPQPEIVSWDLAFRDVPLGESRTVALIISNTGPDPLYISEYMLSDTVNFSYDLYGADRPCTMDGVVGARSFCAIAVTFAPVALTSEDGTFDETFTIFSNDPDEPEYAVKLTGRSGGDGDQDGVLDTEEEGDVNEDGVPDSVQPNVASLHCYDGSAVVAIEVAGGAALGDVWPVPIPDDAGEEFDFPFGLFHFRILLPPAAATATVTLYAPPGTAPETYVKYGPEPGIPGYHLYDFGDESKYPGAVVVEGNRITLTLVDGGAGDHDDADGNGVGEVNGEILDPGAPAMRVAAPADGGGGGGGGSCFIGAAAGINRGTDD